MKFKIDRANKLASIEGLDAASIGAASKDELEALINRIKAVESLVSPVDYDLSVNTTNILSINNSQIATASGNYTLPSVFKSLCDAAKLKGNWNASTVNGVSLEDRWNEGVTPVSARGLIQKGGLFDVVLQELSNRPLVSPDLFLEYSRRFIAEIKKYTSAKIYQFQNWPYQDSTDYVADLTAMDNQYKTISGESGAIILPTGIAWNLLRVNYGFQNLNPYYDNRHPNLIGIYLNALVCFAKIMGVSPVGNAFVPVGISTTDAAKLQDIANKALTSGIIKAFKEFNFTATTVKEGFAIEAGNFKAASIDIYVKDVNWNNGAAQITSLSGNGPWYSGLGYPNINSCGILVYQDPANPIAVTGTPNAPQTIPNLNPNLPISVAVNDGNYGNNTNSNSGGYAFIVGYR